MSGPRRIITMAVGAALATIVLQPATPAAAAAYKPTISIHGNYTYEYENRCMDVSPFTCTVEPGSFTIYVTVYNRPTPASPISVNWRIEDVSTTPGVDYTGPTSGTATIPSTSNSVIAATISVVDDGVPESYEEFWARPFSSSLSNASYSSGRFTIYDGGRIPRDCVETRANRDQRALTCSNRPAGQRWQIILHCFHPWAGTEPFYGNIVTGNGRSEMSCDSADSWFAGLSYFHVAS